MKRQAKNCIVNKRFQLVFYWDSRTTTLETDFWFLPGIPIGKLKNPILHLYQHGFYLSRITHNWQDAKVKMYVQQNMERELLAKEVYLTVHHCCKWAQYYQAD